METALLAGGCFWCLEAVFRRLGGVQAVESGYCGGQLPDPDYQQVCSGQTGHAETVKIEFDPALISYPTLLQVFFALHDPTTRNRQGHDVGTQYRSVIFYLDPQQKQQAQALINSLNQSGQFSAPIVTELNAAASFYPAEASHQNYFARHDNAPYCRAVIAPKLAALGKQFDSLLK